MNRDLEKQMDEMGPAYRAVVARLRAGREAQEKATGGARRWLVAALVLVAVGIPCLRLCRQYAFPSARHPVLSGLAPSPSRCPREYRASVDEMIATQNPDGSWQSDFLTRRNAAALKGVGGPAAAIAYKKAMRYLHAKGLEPTRI